MSNRKIKLKEQELGYGYAHSEFVEMIEERYMKRVVHRLTGDNDGDIFKHPLVKRHDNELYEDHRLELITAYTMGALDWKIDERDCGPLLGLHDHKGWLASFWDSTAKLSEIAAVHDAWNAHYEHLHIAVIYNGINDPATREYEITYETAS